MDTGGASETYETHQFPLAGASLLMHINSTCLFDARVGEQFATCEN